MQAATIVIETAQIHWLLLHLMVQIFEVGKYYYIIGTRPHLV